MGIANAPTGPPSVDWDLLDPGAHVVQFYEDDGFLRDAATRFIGSGLDVGEGAVVVATLAHRDSLTAHLRANGVDVDAARQDGRFVLADAADSLAKFMVDGRPDSARFADVIGGLIAQVAARSRSQRVRVFGEMVALLWAEDNEDAALRLETLWNDLARTFAFSLLCAYPMNGFSKEAHRRSFRDVCAAHSQVVPAEGYTALATRDAQLRVISELQQKALTLDREIAARAQLEEELKARLAERSEIDRRKDEFLAMLGHELRNPLAAVQNAIATARLDASRRERALEIAGRQAEQLARLVDDLLDVSRITQGRIALRREPVSLVAVVQGAIENVRSYIDDRGHHVAVTMPPGDELIVEGDASRLEQVVVNLLTNAAKYSDPGSRIDVIAERWEGEALLRVRDTGIGIAPEVLPRIFELFAQAERGLDRAQGGLGIGLTIARRLVELHGGRIEASSAGIGRGAEFVVSLPASAAETHAAAAQTRRPSAHRRCACVLMVEDNREGAESLMMLLELLGHHVRVLHDGLTAIDAARVNPPDVMLVDIGLPGIDGYEVARRVRREAALHDVILVALTGYGRDEDKQHALAAGFDYHLTKPVDPQALEDLVARSARADATSRTLQ